MKCLNLSLIQSHLVLICTLLISNYIDGTGKHQLLFSEAFVTNSNYSSSSRSNAFSIFTKTKHIHIPPPNNIDERLMMLPNDFSIITSAYTSSLAEYPLITKSATGFVLCGVGDVLAQSRVNSNDEKKSTISRFDWKRLGRFASKGAFGTIIWVKWYDLSDKFVNHLALLETLTGGSNSITASILKTVLLIIMEQFIACPLIYGFWEIPVATVLNGAATSEIKYEIKSKLGSMLVENAKIWTFANLVIYNAPVQYRAALGNLIDILWQSIVSDFAADCGGNVTGKKVLLEESTVGSFDDCQDVTKEKVVV